MIFRAMVLALLPVTAVAEDCGEAATQMDMNLCAQKRFEAADAELNAAWTPAMDRMREFDDGLSAEDDRAADALRAAQRTWITFRDESCRAEGLTYRGGSMRPMIEAMCLTRMTEARTAELRELAKRY